jgi:hypothetical protein
MPGASFDHGPYPPLAVVTRRTETEVVGEILITSTAINGWNGFNLDVTGELLPTDD